MISAFSMTTSKLLLNVERAAKLDTVEVTVKPGAGGRGGEGDKNNQKPGVRIELASCTLRRFSRQANGCPDVKNTTNAQVTKQKKKKRSKY